MWSFCGGSLQAGESLIQCALRETKEETGLTLRGAALCESLSGKGAESARRHSRCTADSDLFARDLSRPAVFTAVDVIDRDPRRGSLRFHYAVVEVAATVEDPRATPVARDDALEAQWFAASKLITLSNLVPKAVEVVKEALLRFDKLPIE